MLRVKLKAGASEGRKFTVEFSGSFMLLSFKEN